MPGWPVVFLAGRPALRGLPLSGGAGKQGALPAHLQIFTWQTDNRQPIKSRQEDGRLSACVEPFDPALAGLTAPSEVEGLRRDVVRCRFCIGLRGGPPCAKIHLKPARGLWYVKILSRAVTGRGRRSNGRLAQPVRAPSSHGGGHWFDPSSAHHDSAA